MKNNIITVSGDPGSGKSTVCNLLKETLGFEIYSAGEIFRHLATERGLSVSDMNTVAKSDPYFDKLIDDTLAKLGREKTNIIFDSRLAWHFVPDSFKVKLTVQIPDAAARVMKAARGNIEQYETVKDAENALNERRIAERVRYSEKYSVDIENPENYDLIIDTSFMSPENVEKCIVNGYKKWAEE